MSKILKIVLRGGLLSLALSLFISCAGGAGGGGGSAGDEATSLSIQLPTTIENSGSALSRSSTQYAKIDSNFETFTVTITSSSYKATKSCGRGETLTFSNIPVGHYDVVALAKKADGAVTAKGTATVDVEADVTKTVTITLTRLYYHTVTFQSKRIDNNPNSGSYMQPVDYTFTQEVSDGYTAVKPANPTLTGKTFSFWSISPDSLTPFSFNTAITDDITLYAQFDVAHYTIDEFLAATDFGTTSSASSPYKIKLTDVTDNNISQLKAKIYGNETSGDMENVYITLDLSECTGLTTIPSSAFSGLTVRWNDEVEEHRGSLVGITLPDTITRIESTAFFQSDLKTINIPEGVTFIGESAFNAARLTGELRLPSTLTTVVSGAFRYEHDLTKVYAPEGLNLSAAEIECTIERY